MPPIIFGIRRQRCNSIFLSAEKFELIGKKIIDKGLFYCDIGLLEGTKGSVEDIVFELLVENDVPLLGHRESILIT